MPESARFREPRLSPSKDPLHEFERRRFLFVTGKGGVGKTTVTAALATALAGRGRRVLVALCGPEERLSAALDVPPIGNDVVKVRKNLFAVYITPAVAVSQYGAMVLKSRRVYSRLFENKYVRNFLEAVPGLNEWAVLGQAWYFTTERLDSGMPRFDTVLLDAPATGHALDMLRVPKVIVEVAPTGVLRRDAQAAWRLLKNPAESGVVIVTLAEELPASETLELAGELRNELGLPVVGLVVNQLLPNLFSDQERARLLEKRPRISESGAWLTLAEVATRRALREHLQADLLKRLQAVPGPQWRLPLLPEAAGEGRLIVSLARTLSGDTHGEFDGPVLRAKR